jgi:hypothetical protein
MMFGSLGTGALGDGDGPLQFMVPLLHAWCYGDVAAGRRSRFRILYVTADVRPISVVTRQHPSPESPTSPLACSLSLPTNTRRLLGLSANVLMLVAKCSQTAKPTHNTSQQQPACQGELSINGLGRFSTIRVGVPHHPLADILHAGLLNLIAQRVEDFLFDDQFVAPGDRQFAVKTASSSSVR